MSDSSSERPDWTEWSDVIADACDAGHIVPFCWLVELPDGGLARSPEELKELFPTLRDDPQAPVHWKHVCYAMINQDVQEHGTSWEKCLDCGDPFVAGSTGADGYERGTFCSKSCEQKTRAYMANPEFG